jgi:methionyl-tRNA synthetase
MPKTCKKVCITTPIYYVNDVPHIGHAYTTIIADTMARYSRLVGYDTLFLTGTDEHGQKIEESAKKRGKSAKNYADEISSKFKNLWDEFDITYDTFIRTTDKLHIEGVQKAFMKMYENGDIYKDKYKGNYCVSCETFFTSSQLVDEDFCPDCGKETSIVEEESYFFRLSKYEDRLLSMYKENDKFILPKSKKNEVINFVKDGLMDLSISRTTFDWGIGLPKEMNEPKHVMYVWLDALLNYITALGYKDGDDMEFWPCSTHFVGKDILRFHAIYWPAFLMSLGLAMPKHIATHGWWTRDGAKMSKSKGNVVDPKEIADAYGLENFRYFMLREVPFGGDGDFSQTALMERINSDLGNNYGNLLNRIIGISNKYFDGKIDSSNLHKYLQTENSKIDLILKDVEELLYEAQTHKFLEKLWVILAILNKAIDEHKPWELMKQNEEEKVMALLALVANGLAKFSILLHPVMPKTTSKVALSLGFTIDSSSYQKYIEKKEMLDTFNIKDIGVLFPRVEKKVIEETKEEIVEDSLITIDKFFDVELKIGTIIKASEVEKSKKLLLLKVDMGGTTKQIVAGIREFYSTNDLLNTQVCVVANLKPAKLMGLISEGMLLAAKDSDGLSLIRPETNKKNGTKIS